MGCMMSLVKRVPMPMDAWVLEALSVTKEEKPKLLIDGREWQSVFAYVSQHDTRQHALHRAMLHKFCQNVHLQANLDDGDGAITACQGLAHDLQGCVRYLCEELLPYNNERLQPLLFAIEPGYLPATIKNAVTSVFHRAQPFIGATRALTMARMHLQKLTMGCTFEDAQESLLKSFLLDG